MFSRNLFRKITDRERKKNLHRSKWDRGRKFRKETVLHRKDREKFFKIETFKVCQIYYGLLNDIIQNVYKSKLIMVLIQVSKIPTLFAF